MDYQEGFESLVQELEDTQIHITTSKLHGQIDIQQKNELAAVLDHIANTYPIRSELLVKHLAIISTIWTEFADSPDIADQYTTQARKALLASVCDDYTLTETEQNL